jgi:chitosanase
MPPNPLSAVVCNGKVFYGVMGDTNGDDPEVIGEASLLLANTCFPRENLNGGVGHPKIDVLCKFPKARLLIRYYIYD